MVEVESFTIISIPLAAIIDPSHSAIFSFKYSTGHFSRSKVGKHKYLSLIIPLLYL